MNFKDLGLSDKTINAIEEVGITEPTTVQVDVIPSILEGKDVFTIAPRGCGKSTSYIFPLIDIISNKAGQNILIITPSSEESVEISDSLAVFNKYHEIQESENTENESDFSDEANVIIGFPELLIELAEANKIDMSNINILVVDDINLIKKYKQLDNLNTLLEWLPHDKQNIIYTNRRSKETNYVLDKILKTPQEVKIDKNKEQEAKTTHKSHPKEVNNNKEDAKELVAENIVEQPIVAQNTSNQPVVNQENTNQPVATQEANNQAPRENNKPQDRKQNPRNKKQNNNNKPKAHLVDSNSVNAATKNNSFNGRVPNFLLINGITVDTE